MFVFFGIFVQQFNFDFDMGFSDFWVFSILFKESMINGQIFYDFNVSIMVDKMEGYLWKIMYGDQSYLSGDVYVDIVIIGDLMVLIQVVEVVREVLEEFIVDFDNDGLVGLGFGIINMVMFYK